LVDVRRSDPSDDEESAPVGRRTISTHSPSIPC
jgi:hypothetical protein